MFRIISLLIAMVIIGAGLASLADYPADIALILPGWRIVFTPLAAAVIILLAFLTVLLLIYLIRLILSPLNWGTAWRLHKKAAAYKNLALGLMAAYAGDIIEAREKLDEAKSALPAAREPLTALLMAEIYRAEAQEMELLAPQGEAQMPPVADKTFLPLLQKQFLTAGGYETAKQSEKSRAAKLPVLCALYDQASKAGKFPDAARFAAVAASEQPALSWASLSAISAAAGKGDWQSAAELYDHWREAWRKPIKKDASGRLERAFDYYRQCLLCGQAAAVFPYQPRQGRDLALEAHKLNPQFIPASLLAAEILFQQNEARKAEKLALAAWSQEQHPDLANLFITSGGLTKDAGEKLKRAQELLSASPDSAIAHRAAAEAAFAAKDYILARAHAEKAAAKMPAAGLYILLAEIAAAENKREEIDGFLLKALSAEPDKVWIADGQKLTIWQALSPVSRRFGAVRWQRPSAAVFNEAQISGLAEKLHLRGLQGAAAASASAAALNAPSAELREEIIAPPLHGFAPPNTPKTDKEAEPAPQPAANIPVPPLHGFAPPEPQAEQDSKPAATRLNVDNPGVDK